MTKSQMFKKAHEIARATKEIAGSYRIAFSCALKDLQMESKLVAAGAETWENYGYKRIYLNREIVKNLGFVQASNGKWSKDNSEEITSGNMNAIIGRAFYDCNACCWNFSKCCMGGFSSKHDQELFVSNI